MIMFVFVVGWCAITLSEKGKGKEVIYNVDEKKGVNNRKRSFYLL